MIDLRPVVENIAHAAELAKCLDELQDAQHAHDEGHADASDVAEARGNLAARFDLWSVSVGALAESVGRQLPR